MSVTAFSRLFAGMDKVMMKDVFAQAGLAQAKHLSFNKKDYEKAISDSLEQVEAVLGYPCFVKPANMGSSVGISKCRKERRASNSI